MSPIGQSSAPLDKYIMNRTVIVIKEYGAFGLSKVRYTDEQKDFIVDSKMVTEYPVLERTICIGLLGGRHDGA